MKQEIKIANVLIGLADTDLEGWTLQEETSLTEIALSRQTGTARPKAPSEYDKEIRGYFYKVRYKYSGKVSPNTRDFCKAMIAADKIYRKEDIVAMEKHPVNKGLGPNGSDYYSIWEHKGGAQCSHTWKRLIYRFDGTDGVVTKNTPKGRPSRSKNYIIDDEKARVAPKNTAKKGYLTKHESMNNQEKFKQLEKKMKSMDLSKLINEEKPVEKVPANAVTHAQMDAFKKELIQELTDMANEFKARLEATKMSSQEWKEYFSSLNPKKNG